MQNVFGARGLGEGRERLENVEKSYWQEIHDAPADEDVCVCARSIRGQRFKVEADA
jgi:hypothetical protein